MELQLLLGGREIAVPSPSMRKAQFSHTDTSWSMKSNTIKKQRRLRPHYNEESDQGHQRTFYVY